MHPAWLATNIAGSIHGLLHMGYHTASYGKILNESVDRFLIICNLANISKTIDVAKIVDDLFFQPNGSIYTTGIINYFYFSYFFFFFFVFFIFCLKYLPDLKKIQWEM